MCQVKLHLSSSHLQRGQSAASFASSHVNSGCEGKHAQILPQMNRPRHVCGTGPQTPNSYDLVICSRHGPTQTELTTAQGTLLQPVALLDLWSLLVNWAIFHLIAIMISKYFYIFRELLQYNPSDKVGKEGA
jgi:hypothetical protein